MTDIDIQNAPIRWKVPGAGFIGAGGFVVLVDRDPDPFPCVVYDGPEEEREVHERTCRETWATAWVLEGERSKRRGRPWPSAGFSAPPTT